ncbi:MAG: class I SAM-dependent methyltransferase [Roseiarcus sp.]
MVETKRSSASQLLAPSKQQAATLEQIVASVEALDPSAFVVESQTTIEDRVSFLRIQKLMRACATNYAYVEVGSHIGGTLAPHLADPYCYAAISIDPRPSEQEDARGRSFIYNGNSTSRMIEVLQQALPEGCLAKLSTFDLDAAEVCHADLPARAELLLIDGRHTTTAAFSDAMSLVPAMASDAIISFHDSNLVADAIQNFERYLACAGVEFATVFLRDQVCAIGLRGMAERVAQELGPYALDRTQFLSEARQQVWESIISAALLSAGVSSTSKWATPSNNLVRKETAFALRSEIDEAHRAAALVADDQAKAYAARVTELDQALAQAQSERARLQRELDDVLHSTFWQTTAPVRQAASALIPWLRFSRSNARRSR